MKKVVNILNRSPKQTYLAYGMVVLAYLLILTYFLYRRRIYFPNGPFGGSISREIPLHLFQTGLILLNIAMAIHLVFIFAIGKKTKPYTTLFWIYFVCFNFITIGLGYLFYKWQLAEGKYALYLLIPLYILSLFTLFKWFQKRQQFKGKVDD